MALQVKKFKKKIVEFPAVFFDGSAEAAKEIAAWVGPSAISFSQDEGNENTIEILNWDGKLLCIHGDYIVKHPHGYFYPVTAEKWFTTHCEVD